MTNQFLHPCSNVLNCFTSQFNTSSPIETAGN